MQTPWGLSDDRRRYGPGVVFYSTPSHGGFKLDDPENAKIDPAWRNASGWYEEDCNWCAVALTFPDLFGADALASALRIARDWKPDGYVAATGERLSVSDSYTLRKRAFEIEHAQSWVVIAALSSSRRPGMVDCVATLGGRRGPGAPKRRFLVPAADYQIGEHGFVVPPGRYPFHDGDSSLLADVPYAEPQRAA